MNHESLIIDRIDASIKTIGSLRAQVDAIAAITEVVSDCLVANSTLYTAGNGGSAAQALHLAEELIGRYRSNRPPQAAICLSADATALTCIANDLGYNQVFARQVEALSKPGDVVLVLSTTGKSESIVEALRVAQANDATTIGLLGGDGGACRSLCDHSIVVTGEDSAHIQEAHQVVIHLICEVIEQRSTSEATA